MLNLKFFQRLTARPNSRIEKLCQAYEEIQCAAEQWNTFIAGLVEIRASAEGRMLQRPANPTSEDISNLMFARMEFEAAADTLRGINPGVNSNRSALEAQHVDTLKDGMAAILDALKTKRGQVIEAANKVLAEEGLPPGDLPQCAAIDARIEKVRGVLAMLDHERVSHVDAGHAWNAARECFAPWYEDWKGKNKSAQPPAVMKPRSLAEQFAELREEIAQLKKDLAAARK